MNIALSSNGVLKKLPENVSTAIEDKCLQIFFTFLLKQVLLGYFFIEQSTVFCN